MPFDIDELSKYGKVRVFHMHKHCSWLPSELSLSPLSPSLPYLLCPTLVSCLSLRHINLCILAHEIHAQWGDVTAYRCLANNKKKKTSKTTAKMNIELINRKRTEAPHFDFHFDFDRASAGTHIPIRILSFPLPPPRPLF